MPRYNRPVMAVPELADASLDDLWRTLLISDKMYLLMFMSYDTKIDAVRELRKKGHIPPPAPKSKEMDYFKRRREENPNFKEFEHRRPSLAHDDVLALWKKDKELIAWVDVGMAVQNDEIKQKDKMSTLRKLGGKIPTQEEVKQEIGDSFDFTEFEAAN